ncbi:adenosine receptor A3-like [Stylophora pistillata]|uniref:adenosine receptor A3-like n=1 Tax=Stylophora pistillata TaxID=50429 RepID=UPI000C0510C1|nr:adenosine receptor A3-like [Stylophora pistillata]
MNDSHCEVWMYLVAVTTEIEVLRFAYIFNCVLNIFLSLSAILLNTVTIYVMQKTSSLPKTLKNLKTLLLSLAVSDIGVGLLVQPFYSSLLIKCLQGNFPSCNIFNMFGIICGFFSIASFFGIVAVSVDRFLAVHLHLRYQELVTHKRVASLVVSIWLLSAFGSSMHLWVSSFIQNLSYIVIAILSVIIAALVYIRIYLTVRLHKKNVQALKGQQQDKNTGEMASVVAVVKSAVGIFYVYLVFLACYSPIIVYFAFAEMTTTNSNVLKRVYLFSYTFVFLNSSLNPVIYCLKMKHIRCAVMDLLQKMSWQRNRALH